MTIVLTPERGNATLTINFPDNMDKKRVDKNIQDEKNLWNATEWKVSCFGKVK